MNEKERRSRSHNAVVGECGERIAADWLESHGMRVVDRNWRCRNGEIDVVAVDGDTLVVVEVKTRTGPAGGHPFESITPQKLARLRGLAAAWCAAHTDTRSPQIRLDAVAVLIVHGHAAVEHLRGIA